MPWAFRHILRSAWRRRTSGLLPTVNTGRSDGLRSVPGITFSDALRFFPSFAAWIRKHRFSHLAPRARFLIHFPLSGFLFRFLFPRVLRRTLYTEMLSLLAPSRPGVARHSGRPESGNRVFWQIWLQIAGRELRSSGLVLLWAMDPIHGFGPGIGRFLSHLGIFPDKSSDSAH